MRHRSKKAKVRLGKDANKMLVRKLAFNFLVNGKIVTTEKKVSVLKPYLEKLVEKTKENTQANRDYVLKNLARPNMMKVLFSEVGKGMGDKKGGYFTTQRLYQRESDGALMVSLQWSSPLVLDFSKKKKVSVEPVGTVKKEKKATKSK